MLFSKKTFLVSFCLIFTLMELSFFCFKLQYFLMYTPWVLFLFLIASSFKRTKVFIRDWLVFLLQLLLFDFLRGGISFVRSHYQFPVYSDYIINFESIFTPGNSLANLLQSALTVPGHISWLEAFFAFIYTFHFVYFFIIAFVIWSLRPQEFWRFKGALMSSAFVGLIIYFIVPTVPPWLASEQSLIPVVHNTFQTILAIKFNVLIQAFDTNPVAAMPSLHVAFPAVCFLASLYHFGLKKSWFLGIYLLMVIFSTFLLGAHFIGDVLAGLLLAASCCFVFYFKLQDRGEYAYVATSSELGVQVAMALLYFSAQLVVMWLLTLMKHGL